MSEKAHNPSPAPFRPSSHHLRLCALFAFCFLLFLFIFSSLGARFGPRTLDHLARRDPDPSRSQRLAGLRVTRTLLRAPAQGDRLWQERAAGAPAGFFLGGAVQAERQDRPADAHLWLALDRLGRGDRAGAQAHLDQAGGGMKLPPSPESAAWENGPLGLRLRQSLVPPLSPRPAPSRS